MTPGGQRSPLDWGLFVALSLLWATAYPGTRLAVNPLDPAHGFPPQLVLAGRLTLGAIILMSVALWRKEKFPPLRDIRRWRTLLGLGVLGMTLPFFAITIAQRTIDSSLAALYVAAAPLFVALFAHFFFADERLTTRTIIGLLVGFSGVGLLFGPDAIASFGSASVGAQALCLLATFFYSVTTIIARGAPPMSPIMMSAAFVTLAALVSYIGLFFVDFSAVDPSLSAWAGIGLLGIAPTAMASLLYMNLVARTSATFISLTGYTIPIVSALIGYFLFAEVQAWHSLIAFGLILLGVWLSQRSKRRAQPEN
ncbi:DMT family transporter [Ponticaulis sp.]|uniref:DMT family transporter n=1 Tax=Ponticaulis sp. TaxID=2020902 RepID=UPI000B7244E9|nr:DMT family transporter [Ponticaulis sp.]MAI89321.1 hypothetical protein [Ponticaulis sp.]OUY01301.1 MAG: hypothetical protein CBB65_02400 [Hyphomonadaceae bacterium TMED5]|tara:strand:- start:51540 stop:52469 length:930 start_codon:yes stop_codon:yes gene_type:complete